MSSVTVVFISGSPTIHAVQASRYVPRCRGVTGAVRSDHRSVRFGIVVLCDSHHPKTDEKNSTLNAMRLRYHGELGDVPSVCIWVVYVDPTHLQLSRGGIDLLDLH